MARLGKNGGPEVGTLPSLPLWQGASSCCPTLNPRSPGIWKDHFFQTHSNSQKRTPSFLQALPTVETRLSDCKTCFCAEGSPSGCLACTPFVIMSVPFLFYFTQRGWDNCLLTGPSPPTHTRLSPVNVTRNFWLKPWAEKATKGQARFWG